MNTNDSGTGSLRDAVNNAASGEIINFAPGVQGTITLTSGPLTVDAIDLTIVGPGANRMTISGGGEFTDFVLLSTLPPTSPAPPSFVPNSVSISGLTIANGNAANNGFGDGGGILNFDALSISYSVLKGNQAPGDDSAGGAIFIGGGMNASLSLQRDIFQGNSVGLLGDTDSSGLELGGAIDNTDGVVAISSTTFADNLAVGSNAQGGAIQTGINSALTITGSTFAGNQAIGSMGASSITGPGGSTMGGAIAASSADLTVTNTTFVDNQAVGGPGQNGGAGAEADGGAIWARGSSITIQGGLISANTAQGGAGGSAQVAQGGDGGTGGGGGIAIVDGSGLTITGTTIAGNIASGGAGGSGIVQGFGGVGQGGGIETDDASALTFSSGILSRNVSEGGFGGGDGFGGGIYTAGATTFIDASIALNVAEAGFGGAGEGVGGALYIAGGATTLAGTTEVDFNFGITSDNDIFGPFGT